MSFCLLPGLNTALSCICQPFLFHIFCLYLCLYALVFVFVFVFCFQVSTLLSPVFVLRSTFSLSHFKFHFYFLSAPRSQQCSPLYLSTFSLSHFLLVFVCFSICIFICIVLPGLNTALSCIGPQFNLFTFHISSLLLSVCSQVSTGLVWSDLVWSG